MYRSAFPDLRFTIEDMIAEGDKVATCWRAAGTHQGELMGIAPTGKRVEVIGMIVSRFAGGKIVEDLEVMDTLGLLQQLGAIPEAAEPAAASA